MFTVSFFKNELYTGEGCVEMDIPWQLCRTIGPLTLHSQEIIVKMIPWALILTSRSCHISCIVLVPQRAPSDAASDFWRVQTSGHRESMTSCPAASVSSRRGLLDWYITPGKSDTSASLILKLEKKIISLIDRPPTVASETLEGMFLFNNSPNTQCRAPNSLATDFHWAVWHFNFFYQAKAWF